jgi:hypothetical protein
MCAVRAGTWDAKASHLLSILGSFVDVNRQQLAEDGVLSKFVSRVNIEWGRAFVSLEGENIPLQPPTASIPQAMSGYTAC